MRRFHESLQKWVGTRILGPVLVLSLSMGLVAGCGTRDAARSDAKSEAGISDSTAPVPPDSLKETHAGCQWGEIRAGETSIWRFTCARSDIVADENLPGFLREDVLEDGTRVRNVVVQIFAKGADEPIEAILPALRAASPGVGTESCALEASGEGRYVFVPTGEARQLYDKFLNGSAEGPTMPCGIWGPSEAGQRAIFPVPGSNEKVAAVDFGTDPPLHDFRTLKSVAN